MTTHVNAGDWVLVASFDNQTGEAVLDGTIEAALKRELEYSEYVRVAQRDRWEDALRLLGRPLDARLDPALAREVCLRDGSIRGLVTGRVEKRQSRYLITFIIVDPTSGRASATFTEEAPSQSRLLSSVRRQAIRLRGEFGETRATVDNALHELAHAPIPAIAALSLHAKALAQGSVRESAPLPVQWERWAGVERLERDAVREDPAFAYAWIMLAWALRNQDRPQVDYLPYARRAFDLADTATPQERYFILGSFHEMNAFFDGNSRNTDNPTELEQALSAYEALLTLQPDHYYVQNNLQGVYGILGRDHEMALTRIRLAEARPRNVRLNVVAAAVLVDEGNLVAARRYAARAEAALSADAEGDNPGEWSEVQVFRAYLDWIEEKPGESLARARRVAGAIDRVPQGSRTNVTTQLVYLYLALGRLNAAQELAERGRGWEGNAPQPLAYALREHGDLDRLREYMTTRWPHDHSSTITRVGWRVEFLVPAGMLDEAQGEADRYRRQTPETALESSFYPFIMGMLEMGRGHPREAARFLEPWLAAPNKATALQNFQWPAQKLAEAWEALGDTAKAIAVLEKTGERPPGLLIVRHMWLGSKAQLARLYRKTGQERKARAIEDRLLKMLAVADVDHPLLKELRARR